MVWWPRIMVTLSTISVRRRIIKSRQEDVASQVIYEAGYLQTHLSRLIGKHIEAVVIILQPQFILIPRTEGVEPGALKGIVILVDRTACRKARQRLHVGVFLKIVSVPIAQKKLV